MIPNVFPNTNDENHGENGERALYNYMKENLPEQWTVIYNLHLGTNYGDKQIDFLVVVPEKGIVNVDAKGYGYSFENAQWYLRNQPLDIVAHANGAIQSLAKYIGEQLVGDRYWGAYSWIISFAFTDYPEQIPYEENIAQAKNLKDNAEVTLKDKIE